MARTLLFWLVAAWPLGVVLADEALRPREIVPDEADSDPAWRPQSGVTHLDPAQNPRNNRVAPTRTSPIDEPIRDVPPLSVVKLIAVHLAIAEQLR